MTAIRTKPIDDIVWQDIEALAASGAAEDAMLEFKGLLPEKNGKQHPWYQGRDQITDFTRDELAAEVVALANAYGGRLIVGIKETQDRPRKAMGIEPLPRCAIFAEQFEQAFRSIVDPPVGGFQIRAVADPANNDEGAVVIVVPASSLAPHGVGRPPAAYVRRGTSCDPMTMRDLQSVFWEARTRQERVAQIRATHRRALADLRERKEGGTLMLRDGHAMDPDERGMFLRVTAIPQQALELTQLPSEEWRSGLRPSMRRLGSGAAAFGEGAFDSRWSRQAHGVRAEGMGPSTWTVHDDGTVSVIGFRPAAPSRSRGVENWHAPSWHSLAASQILLMADRVRRYGGRPDIPIEIDVEFSHDGTARGGTEQNYQWGEDRAPMLPAVSIGPLLMGPRSDFPVVHERLEELIWNAFGHDAPQRLNFDFANAFPAGT